MYGCCIIAPLNVGVIIVEVVLDELETTTCKFTVAVSATTSVAVGISAIKLLVVK